MLLRNLDVSVGLCNGTRMQILKMTEHNLYCRILTGPRADLNEIHIIPQIKLEYGQNTNERGLRFRRIQFPIKPCFAMTINKVTDNFIYRLLIFCDSLMEAFFSRKDRHSSAWDLS